MHSALLVLSKILMFFIICLLTSFCLLSLLTCVRILNRFWNKCPLLVVLGCCVGCPPVEVVPISGGGVAVG